MKIQLDADDLRPLIQVIVAETIAQIEHDHAQLNGKLGCGEVEAAALLGVEPHTLRDCRRRGEIHARKVGKQFRYSRDELLRFLAGDGEA